MASSTEVATIINLHASPSATAENILCYDACLLVPKTLSQLDLGYDGWGSLEEAELYQEDATLWHIMQHTQGLDQVRTAFDLVLYYICYINNLRAYYPEPTTIDDFNQPNSQKPAPMPPSLNRLGDRTLTRSVTDDFERVSKSSPFRALTARLPELNFITVHYTYFILTCLIASLIFWGSSHPSKSITYTDSLFLVVSAMTEAGLNTVNLSEMTTFQQFVLWFLIIIGSTIFVSISTVLTRKRVFEKRFEYIIAEHKKAKKRQKKEKRGISEDREKPIIQSSDDSGKENPEAIRENMGSRDSAANAESPATLVARNLPYEGEGTRTSGSKEEIRNSALSSHGQSTLQFAPLPARSSRVLSFVGVGAHPYSTSFKLPQMPSLRERQHVSEEDPVLNQLQYPHYLTRSVTGRNGQFFNLSRAEREHLGGVEYRAITFLSWIVPIYFILWQVLGCIGLAAYTAHNKADTSRENGINPWWLGIFNGVSAFNNSGMSLLDANIIPFETSTYTLITMILLILAGNTAYPLFLRLIIWSMLKLLCLIRPDDNQYPDYKATLRFILSYPRRVYTNLFPSEPTWWLLFMIISLNAIDWAAYDLLNIGNQLLPKLPTNYYVLDGLFQAVAVRSGGFYVVPITDLRIGLQFLYIIMMYISVYPVVITMRHSNVYEERSLGIYADDDPETEDVEKNAPLLTKFKRTLTTMSMRPEIFSSKGTGANFVRQQIRGQLAHDLWWLALATLFITCIEVSNFERDPVTYSVFNVMFEVVSGYGCVGISTGLPNEAYSFSGGWKKASKLILCAVMLRGRHRGLPVALDRAVRLPDEIEEEIRQDRDLASRGSGGRVAGENRRPSWARARSLGALSDVEERK
ncbi:hypothetical protein B7494_g2953 [Chlorociboria aeruginascens]|nr:hypothetical protein B7494_g2953 [Chlorociboria aeruginascens]